MARVEGARAARGGGRQTTSAAAVPPGRPASAAAAAPAPSPAAAAVEGDACVCGHGGWPRPGNGIGERPPGSVQGVADG